MGLGPLLVLCDWVGGLGRLRGFEHGGDDDLTKPFRPAELLRGCAT